jgi:hypothetical protein
LEKEGANSGIRHEIWRNSTVSDPMDVHPKSSN